MTSSSYCWRFLANPYEVAGIHLDAAVDQKKDRLVLVGESDIQSEMGWGSDDFCNSDICRMGCHYFVHNDRYQKSNDAKVIPEDACFMHCLPNVHGLYKKIEAIVAAKKGSTCVTSHSMDVIYSVFWDHDLDRALLSMHSGRHLSSSESSREKELKPMMLSKSSDFKEDGHICFVHSVLGGSATNVRGA